MDTTTTETGLAVPVDQPTPLPQNTIPTLSGSLGQALAAAKAQQQPSAYQSITDLKDKGDALIAHIKKHGSSNELSKAVAKIEEGIMWAIKHLGNML